MIGDQPCTGCWETTRAYHFEAVDADDGTIYISSHRINVIVVPVDDGGTTEYRIRTVTHIAQ
jgi:hypothetical protein